MSISYRSYCWVVGTTSFRTKQLNRKIELQLQYLDEFWSDNRYAGNPWSDNSPLQTAYYMLLKEKGFVSGDATRPDKDARQKTSGLVELGLVDDERKLTGAGRHILAISKKGDFSLDPSNTLELSKDSYQYFLQLIKATKPFEGGYVRPFVTFLHVLNKIVPDSRSRKYLSDLEFTYLLPMCVDASSTKMIVDMINIARQKGKSIDVDSTIVSVLMQMENYREALRLFRSATKVDEDIICLIGMNRKSGANGLARYDAPYLGIYNALHALVFDGVSSIRVNHFVKALEGCKLKKLWVEYFFNKGAGRRLSKNPMAHMCRDNIILASKTEDEFRCSFFKVMHMLKAKATLKDYADLNRRYFGLSDLILFNDDTVELDLLPRAFVEQIGAWLEIEAFRNCNILDQDVSIERIIPVDLPKKEELVVAATGRSLSSVTASGGTKAVLKSERYARFSKMLHEKFPKETIKKLLEMFEDRAQDAEVQKIVTDNADVPTIFEYVVALAWYYVSGETGDVLEYMNLSLGPDFLPKSHAGGGEADIVWQYPANPPVYDKHSLLIEVTLSEKESQRRMEMEPVSRHLGQYMLSHPTEVHSYCTFVTTYLDLNVISDFRGKKHQKFYNPAKRGEYVDGMKIIPIDTQMLCKILDKDLRYPAIYNVFDSFHKRDDDPVEWHDELRSAINQ